MLDNGTHQRRDHFGEKRRKTHWKQETGGLALSMTSEVHAEDPCPEFPKWLFQSEVVAEIASLAQPEKTLENKDDSLEEESLLETQDRAGFEWTPQVLSREVIASTDGTEVAHHLEWVAWEHGITAAKRQAFVSDGASGIWSIHKKHFSQMIPILDLLHALSYAHRAAAGIDQPELYRRWAMAIWQGCVGEVIEELKQHQARIGPPPPEASADDPRQRIHRALTYYTNNQSRMNYPEYRRLGLPITSSLMESTIKELSRRVKGTEKFWQKNGGRDLTAACRLPQRLQPTRGLLETLARKNHRLKSIPSQSLSHIPGNAPSSQLIKSGGAKTRVIWISSLISRSHFDDEFIVDIKASFWGARLLSRRPRNNHGLSLQDWAL